jgi:hypothetical protein
MIAPNSRLLSRRAWLNSRRHQRESSQARETRNSTAWQREAASFSARSQRSPALMPRSGSRSRKTSSQPSAASQSRIATASVSFALEWLMNRRATVCSATMREDASSRL